MISRGRKAGKLKYTKSPPIQEESQRYPKYPTEREEAGLSCKDQPRAPGSDQGYSCHITLPS